jgi:8-oxo-dGTP diphosphatase
MVAVMSASHYPTGYHGAQMPGRAIDPEVARAFGRAVRIARVRMGLELREVARRAGIPPGTLGRYERGERSAALDVFIAIAGSLEMTEVDLLRATMDELRAVRALRRRPAVEVVRGAQPRPPVAACYIVQAGRLLMVQRRFKEGTLEWAGPSGKIEAGETPEQAAVRETMEEVGVEIEPVAILGDRVHPATGAHLIYVACRYVAGEARIVDHEEVSDVEWVPIPEALERWRDLTGGVFPPVREYLERKWANHLSQAATEERG